MNLHEERSLTLPRLMFVVGTRAALAAGVALLASERMPKRARRAAGATLALVGIATTIPAARIAFGHKPSLRERARRLIG